MYRIHSDVIFVGEGKGNYFGMILAIYWRIISCTENTGNTSAGLKLFFGSKMGAKMSIDLV